MLEAAGNEQRRQSQQDSVDKQGTSRGEKERHTKFKQKLNERITNSDDRKIKGKSSQPWEFSREAGGSNEANRTHEAASSRQAIYRSAGPKQEGGLWAQDELLMVPLLQDIEGDSRAEARASTSERESSVLTSP